MRTQFANAAVSLYNLYKDDRGKLLKFKLTKLTIVI